MTSVSIGPHGRAIWASVQDRVFKLVPATSKVTSFLAPLQPVSPKAPALGDDHNPVGIAAAPNGDLAIAEMATAAVSIVSPSDSVIATVRLPKNTAASAIAYDTKGDLAVALIHYPGAASDSILLHPAKGGWRKVRVPDTFLVGETSSFVTGFDRDLESVDAMTGVKTRLVPRSLLPGTGPDRPLLGVAALELGEHVAYGTASGIAVVNRTDKRTRRFTFPTYNCGSPGSPADPRQPGVGVTPTTVPTRCPSYPTSLTADGRGNIWYQSSHGGIDLIARASY